MPSPAPSVTLRAVVEADLQALFEFQRQPAANAMAAFPPRGRDAFMAHWRENVLGKDDVTKRTVLCDDRIAGSIVSYADADSGRQLVGYWIGEEFWGRGVATRALTLLVEELPGRPLHAFVATTNVGSIRVLEKCAFERIGKQRGNHGDDTVEVFVYELR